MALSSLGAEANKVRRLRVRVERPKLGESRYDDLGVRATNFGPRLRDGKYSIEICSASVRSALDSSRNTARVPPFDARYLRQRPSLRRFAGLLNAPKGV